MLTTIANSALGYAYWVLGARAYPAREVGIATALISAMQLVSLVSNLGTGSALVGVLPKRSAGREWSAAVNAALAVGTTAGLLVATGVMFVLPALSSDLAVVRHEWLYAALFLGGVAVFTAGTVLDYVFVAERSAHNMLIRNVLFGGLKIPLLALPVALATATALGIFASWVLSGVVACAVAIGMLFPRLRRGYAASAWSIAGEVKRVGPSLIGYHLINVGGMVPMYALPPIVATRLSVTDSAYFYVAWLTGAIFFVISPAVASALFAEGSHAPDALRAKVRSAARIISLLTLPAIVVALVGADWILQVFGDDYSRHGATLLRVLALSAVPDAITNVFVAAMQVKRRLLVGAQLNLGMGVSALVLAWFLLPGMGIAGAGVAWLVAQCLGSLLVGGYILRARRRSSRTERPGARNGARPRARTNGHSPSANEAHERTHVCVVGSGTTFLSGISVYTHRLAETLATRHEVSVILMRRLLPRRLYPGRARVGSTLSNIAYSPNVKTFDGVDWYWLPSIVRAVAFLVRHRPKVVVFQWWSGTVLHSYLVLAAAARVLGARIVVEVHELQDTGEARIPLARPYVAVLLRGLLSLASGYVVHSKHDERELHEQFRVGSRPVLTIPLGPFDQYIKATDRSARPRSPAEPFELLFFGTIRPYKGLEDLIAAFEAIPEVEIDSYHLTVVGETWEGWTLPAELISNSARRSRITFVNRYVTDEEVAEHFAKADAVALPYHRSSASGPLHVAMANGLPVVVTDVGGLREAAREYDGARFVPPRNVDALASALRELRELRGASFADPHSWEQTASSYESFFRALGVLAPAPIVTSGITDRSRTG